MEHAESAAAAWRALLSVPALGPDVEIRVACSVHKKFHEVSLLLRSVVFLLTFTYTFHCALFTPPPLPEKLHPWDAFWSVFFGLDLQKCSCPPLR